MTAAFLCSEAMLYKLSAEKGEYRYNPYVILQYILPDNWSRTIQAFCWMKEGLNLQWQAGLAAREITVSFYQTIQVQGACAVKNLRCRRVNEQDVTPNPGMQRQHAPLCWWKQAQEFLQRDQERIAIFFYYLRLMVQVPWDNSRQH